MLWAVKRANILSLKIWNTPNLGLMTSPFHALAVGLDGFRKYII